MVPASPQPPAPSGLGARARSISRGATLAQVCLLEKDWVRWPIAIICAPAVSVSLRPAYQRKPSKLVNGRLASVCAQQALSPIGQGRKSHHRSAYRPMLSPVLRWAISSFSHKYWWITQSPGDFFIDSGERAVGGPSGSRLTPKPWKPHRLCETLVAFARAFLGFRGDVLSASDFAVGIRHRFTQRPAALGAALALLGAGEANSAVAPALEPCIGTTCAVNSAPDLVTAITTVGNDPNTSNASNTLPPINTNTRVTVHGVQRGFFVHSSAITIENLTTENATAVGGAGGSGISRLPEAIQAPNRIADRGPDK
jgi:hypothetical protein